MHHLGRRRQPAQNLRKHGFEKAKGGTLSQIALEDEFRQALQRQTPPRSSFIAFFKKFLIESVFFNLLIRTTQREAVDLGSPGCLTKGDKKDRLDSSLWKAYLTM